MFVGLVQTMMPFAKNKSAAAIIGGPEALDIKLPFDETALLQENAAYIQRYYQWSQLCSPLFHQIQFGLSQA